MQQRTASRVIGGVTLGWLACFSYLTLSPQIPDLPGVAASDRVLGSGHLVASLVLAALVYLWLVVASPDRPRERAAVVAFGAAAGFGLVVELIQFPVPEREPQVTDAVLDVVGSAIAVAALTAVPVATLRQPRVPVVVGAAGTLLVASTTGWLVWGTTATPAELRCPGGVTAEQPRGTHQPVDTPASRGRVEDGLVTLYDFDDGATADAVGGLDLVARGDVAPLAPSGVRLDGGDSVLTSDVPARPIVDAVVDQLTLEAWVRPDDLGQGGPARIVSSSVGVALDEVNFHLGQDRHCLSVRLDVGGAEAEWWQLDGVFDREQAAWHLAVTYDGGTIRAYVDGVLRFDTTPAEADLSGWSDEYPLLVGNEATGDRPFRGDVYLVAVYDRALRADEVARNYEAGP